MMDALIERYVALRDKKSELEAAHKAKLALLDAGMDKIESAILAELNKEGLESIGSAAGTAFKSTVTSATVADRDAYLAFLKETENWHLADIRPAKKAVAEYRAANDDLPPGINWREEVVVRIRRA